MAEESQNLVQTEIPEENVGTTHPRTLTCNRNTGITVLSVFVGLLLAGQAVSVYFMTQQQSTIEQLSAATTALKLKDMIKNLPGTPPSQNRQRPKMAIMSIPLAFSDTDGSKPNLLKIAQESNKIEDAVKYWLLRNNPLRTYPLMNGTILDNLRKLKNTLNDQEWMVFDSWMQQWFLFHLVQTTETSNPTADPAPNPTTSGAYVMSDCFEKSKVEVHPGTFVPECTEDGDYKDMQCWRSTGFCWCVYKNGTEIPGTRSRAKIDCKDIQEVDGDDGDYGMAELLA